MKTMMRAWWHSVVATAVASLFASDASAQVVWNGVSGTNQFTNNNAWLPTTAPGVGSTAIFPYLPSSSPVTITVDTTSGGTAGIINFNDINQNYQFTSSGSLTLNNGGSDAQLNVNGGFSGALFFGGSNTISYGNNLVVTNNDRWGGNSNSLNFSGPISGNGFTHTSTSYAQTTINGALTVSSFTVSGNGLVILGNTGNSLGSAINLNGGLLQVAANTNLGSDSTPVVFNGGTLRLGTVTTNSGRSLSIPANQVGSVEVTSTNVWTFTAANALTGSGIFNKYDSGTLAFTNSNSFTGNVVIGSLGNNVLSLGTLTPGTNNVIAPSSSSSGPVNSIQLSGATGTMNGAAVITVNSYARLQVTQSASGDTTTIANRIGSVPINLNGGEFRISPGAAVAVNDNIGSLTLEGLGVIRNGASSGNLGGTQINFSLLNRNNNAVLYLGGQTSGNGQFGGTPSSATINVKASSGVSDPGGSGTSRGIIPWATLTDFAVVTFNTQAGNNARQLVTYDSNGFRPLTASEVSTIAFAGNLSAGNNNSITGSPATLAGPISVNSILSNSGGPTISGAGNTLTVASGGIVVFSSLTFSNTVVDFNGTTGYIHLGGSASLTNGSTLQNANGLVVSGINNQGFRLDVTGATSGNSFTGGLFVYGNLQTPSSSPVLSAGVSFNNNNQLGAANGGITLNGGVVRMSATSGTQDITGRSITLNGPGGISANSGGTVTVPGTISGNGQLMINTGSDTGTVSLTNASANTYTGGTFLNAGTLAISRGDHLGTGMLVMPGGTLRTDAALTLANNIMIGGFGVTINTNGNNATFSGSLLGNGSGVTKSGGGVLTLSGTNPFSSSVTVSSGTLLVNGSIGYGTNSVSVSAGATLGGSGTINRPISITGNLSPGQSPGILTVNAAGTAVTFNSASTFVVDITGNTVGTGYDQLFVQNGNITLGSGIANISFPTPSGTFSDGDRLVIINNAGGGTTTGNFAGLTDGALVPALTGLGGLTWNIYYNADATSLALSGSNDVILVATAVPEPMTLGLIGMALAGSAAGAWHYRRRQRKLLDSRLR